MKQRLISFAIAGVMLTSLGAAVSAAPNGRALEASCHGQEVSRLASSGIDVPGKSGNNPGDWNKQIKVECTE